MLRARAPPRNPAVPMPIREPAASRGRAFERERMELAEGGGVSWTLARRMRLTGRRVRASLLAFPAVTVTTRPHVARCRRRPATPTADPDPDPPRQEPP